MRAAHHQPVTVLKVGGELIESDVRASQMAAPIHELASRGPLAVVHGGGKDIDTETARRGLVKHAVDGLRVTDAATRDAVVAALAGTVNTRLVAALAAQGVRAVGLTGADALCGLAALARPHLAASGAATHLGLVGEPSGADPRLLVDLMALGYVPVLASLGCTTDGTILNVNADTLASAVARQLGATRLIVAGATPGVLDADGTTIPVLDVALLDALIADGRASAGMVAKLRACRAAVEAGLDVEIVDGRQVASFNDATGTRFVAAVHVRSGHGPQPRARSNAVADGAPELQPGPRAVPDGTHPDGGPETLNRVLTCSMTAQGSGLRAQASAGRKIP